MAETRLVSRLRTTTIFRLPVDQVASRKRCFTGLAVDRDNRTNLMWTLDDANSVFTISSPHVTSLRETAVLKGSFVLRDLQLGASGELVVSTGADLMVLHTDGTCRSLFRRKDTYTGANHLRFIEPYYKFCFTDQFDVISCGISQDGRSYILKIDPSLQSFSVLYSLDRGDRISSLAYDRLGSRASMAFTLE